MSDRKYALTRIRRGDYLLLSNDGSTVWRISTYNEDGSALENGTNRPITGKFWGAWRWRYAASSGRVIDAADWNDFDMHEGMRRTRAEAVASVLRSIS